MSERENLFRPIHKGIRLMLYQLGSGLQAQSFTNVEESNEFVARLKRNLGDSLSNCILCLLTIHAHHEEKDIFAKVRVHDSDAVDAVMKEHVEIARLVRSVSATCDELQTMADAKRRIEVGDRLIQEVNELIALYLAHLNNEESLLVPVMWQWFNDDQLREMRRVFYDTLPLSMFETWMRWTLPAMNTDELVILFAGLKTYPESPRIKDWVRLAHEVLDFDRWAALRQGVDLPWGN
ncbi:MAG: hemerythrin domain-containing protein [Thermoplasmata archaeon]